MGNEHKIEPVVASGDLSQTVDLTRVRVLEQMLDNIAGVLLAVGGDVENKQGLPCQKGHGTAAAEA